MDVYYSKQSSREILTSLSKRDLHLFMRFTAVKSIIPKWPFENVHETNFMEFLIKFNPPDLTEVSLVPIIN